MHTLTIRTTPSYSLYIAPGLLNHSLVQSTCRALARRWAIVSDEQVAPLYAELIQQQLPDASLFTLSSGEQNKTRETKAYLEDQLLHAGYGKDSGLIALGGGVICDLTGFVAATYCRGIPVIYLPTTLLAMVDASIGGKTAVNTPYGKNMIGVFKQPNAVFIDPAILTTLSKKEMQNGLMEAIKHALIADPGLWRWLQQHWSKLFNHDQQALTELILASCRIKQSIIEHDPYEEKGLRHLLNFGHTIGHALEAASNYTLKHGFAVELGILTESYLAKQLSLLSEEDFHAIQGFLAGLPIPPPASTKQWCTQENLYPFLKLDKKTQANQARFVLLNGIGQPYSNQGAYTHSVSLTTLNSAIAHCYSWIEQLEHKHTLNT